MKIDLNKKEKIWLLIVGLLIFTTPIIFTRSLGIISFGEADSNIGSALSGITAPFLSFFGSILVFLALKAQVDANDKIQKQFDEQKLIDYRQNFENTFFNMLSIYHQIVDSMDFNMFSIRNPLDNYVTTKAENNDFRIAIFNKENIESRDVFKNTLLLLYSLIKDDLNNQNLFQDFGESKVVLKNPNVKSHFPSIYRFIYSKIDTTFGHYFRHLYRVIKIIDEQTFTDNSIDNFKIQYSYTSIIRAQLSDAEVQWMFFNCISDMGNKKFKPLVEKYTLLKIINLENKVYKYYSILYRGTAFVKPKSSELPNHIISFKINKF